MEHIRNFLRGRGFALALLACVAAAAAVGVWAVRTVRDQMAKDLGEDPGRSITGEETYPGIDEGVMPDTPDTAPPTSVAAMETTNTERSLRLTLPSTGGVCFSMP